MSTHGGTSTSAPPATTVTGPDTIGAPAVVGTGLHYARNDHDHGLPALDYNSMQYNDLLGWTYDPVSINSSNNYAGAAQVMVSRIPLPAVMTVTNVLAQVIVLGLTLTHSFLALFKSNGTVIGQSADQSTAWGAVGATGLYTLPLVGGPYVCTPRAANDFLWAAWYVGTATTAPSFSVNANSSGGVLIGETAARIRSGTIAQANTATLGSIVPGSINSSGTTYWFGLS